MRRFVLGMKDSGFGTFEFTTFDRWANIKPDDQSLYIDVDNDAECEVADSLIRESAVGFLPRQRAAYVEAAMTVYRKNQPLGTCYVHPRFR